MTDYFSVRDLEVPPKPVPPDPEVPPQGISKPHYKYPEVPPRSTPKYHHDSDAGVSKYHHRSIFRVPELPPRVFEIPIMRFRLRSAEFPCLAGVWGVPKYHYAGDDRDSEVPP